MVPATMVAAAYGLAAADVVEEMQEPSAVVLGDDTCPGLLLRLAALAAECVARLEAQGFARNSIRGM